MLNSILDNIKQGNSVKENVLAFKQAVKDIPANDISDEIRNSYDIFVSLMSSDDPKIRKNSVLILGYLSAGKAVDDIYEAYLKETTNFNKAAYLESLSMLDYSPLIMKLSSRFDELKSIDCSLDNKKHHIEEVHALSQLLIPFFGKHEFIGSELLNEFVLLTNRNFKKITMDSLKGVPHKEFTAGVMVKTKQLDRVRKGIRTYSELLFIPDEARMCSSDPSAAAAELIKAGLINYLNERISNNDSPIAFRIDYRTKDVKKSAEFSKRLASELELLSHWHLVNSTGNYEIELRFIDTSDSKLIVLVRFTSLQDDRFNYRKQTIAVSLKPYLAALMAELGSEYFKENASVLDPFCGCGTMLIERNIFKPVRIMYGVDIFGGAIKAAAENISAAGISSKTELITKDFFEFRHAHRFDEIFTDMPAAGSNKDLADIESIYRRFFKSIPVLLEDEAHLFIYSRNRDFLRKYALTSGFKILKEYEISKMEGSYFFILSK